MQTILHILKRAGGWHPGLSLTIDNPPFMPLVIEALDESGPCGLPALSVAHYGEQSGDLMRDPEMCVELSFAGSIADLNPFYYRPDYLGCEQWSRFITGNDYAYVCELHRQHVSFAKVWNRNLQSQGFAEAFEQQRKQAA
jgi:hypothetical protein